MPKPQGHMKLTGDIHPPEIESELDELEDPEYETNQPPSREPLRMQMAKPPSWVPLAIGLGLAFLVTRLLRS